MIFEVLPALAMWAGVFELALVAKMPKPISYVFEIVCDAAERFPRLRIIPPPNKCGKKQKYRNKNSNLRYFKQKPLYEERHRLFSR